VQAGRDSRTPAGCECASAGSGASGHLRVTHATRPPRVPGRRGLAGRM